MPKLVITTPLSLALRTVRRHFDWQQGDLAERLHVSRRSIVRWERGECEPFPPQREGLLFRLSDAPNSVLEPLARALYVPLKRPVLPPAERKRALDAHLHVVAESVDLSARRVREAVVSVLGKAAELGLTVEEAGALLAPSASPGQGLAPK